MGYLTLRLRGSFFAIATLALAVVLQTLDRQLGLRWWLARRLCHSPGKLRIRHFQVNYIEYLFALMLLLAVLSH